MEEIRPGIFHWKTFHEKIEKQVHSYCVRTPTTTFLIDPRLSREGLAWFQKKGVPSEIYLTNRHHYRHANAFVKAFGARVWCHSAGLSHFRKEQNVRPFEHGDRLPGGVLALKVGALCPEETALFLPRRGAMALGDAVIREKGRLSFVPDELMGDDPQDVKSGLLLSFRSLLRRKFDTLLLAHGKPYSQGGKEALQRFVDAQPLPVLKKSA